MTDNQANPHVKIRGDVFDEKEYEERMTELTGIPTQERKKQMNQVVERFKIEMRQSINDLRKRLYDLEMENIQLKLKIHSLENKVEDGSDTK